MAEFILSGIAVERLDDVPPHTEYEWCLVRTRKLYHRTRKGWIRVKPGLHEVFLFGDKCTKRVFVIKRQEQACECPPVPIPIPVPPPPCVCPPPVIPVPACIVAPGGPQIAEACATDAGNVDATVTNNFRVLPETNPVAPALRLFDYYAPNGSLIFGQQPSTFDPTTFGVNSLTMGIETHASGPHSIAAGNNSLTGVGGAEAGAFGIGESSDPTSAGRHSVNTEASFIFGRNDIAEAFPIPTPGVVPSDGRYSVVVGHQGWAHMRSSFVQGSGATQTVSNPPGVVGGHQFIRVPVVGRGSEVQPGPSVVPHLVDVQNLVTFPITTTTDVTAIINFYAVGTVSLGPGLAAPVVKATAVVSRVGGTYIFGAVNTDPVITNGSLTLIPLGTSPFNSSPGFSFAIEFVNPPMVPVQTFYGFFEVYMNIIGPSAAAPEPRPARLFGRK